MRRPPSREVEFRPRAGAGGATPPAFDPGSLLGEGEELVAGRRPVEEAFVARRASKRLLVVPTRRTALDALVLHATTLRIPVVEVEGGTLTALAGFDGHQGVALVVSPRQWATLEDVIVRALERGERPFILALDSLEDPHNLGSLLRTAEAAGVHGVIFPTRRAAPLSPSAVKASAGAVEHLLLVPVSDLPGALADLHVRGLRIVGADQSATLTYREADLRGPLVVVVGSEGQGIGPAIRRRLDLTVRIPMHGRIASLNAAVAGSVLLLEASGQRGPSPARSTEPVGGGSVTMAGATAPLTVEGAAEAAEEGPGAPGPVDDADAGTDSGPIDALLP
jgi:23S rRNA (guanosine2251-2'-O)-methyltransferase